MNILENKKRIKTYPKQIKQLKKALKELKTGKDIFDQVQQKFLIDINSLKALDSVVPQEDPKVINLLIKIKDLMNNNVFLKRANKVLKRIEKMTANKKSLFHGLLCFIEGCFKSSKSLLISSWINNILLMQPIIASHKLLFSDSSL